MPTTLLQYLSAHSAEMAAQLEELVRLESPSDDPTAVDAAMRWISESFGGLGATVERLAGHPSADHLRVRLWPRGDTDPQILLLAHADTVWPVGTLAKRPYCVDGDLGYGPGAYDMKGGVILALWAIKALDALGRRPKRPITLLVNSDEETGSLTSRSYIEEEARRSASVLVLEPAMPDGSVKTWRKGVGLFRVEAKGRSAHAGADPEKGISAIQEIASQILRLHALTEFDLGITVNAGRVGGGSRVNVVADSAWVELDVRVKTRAEADRIQAFISGLEPAVQGAELTVSGGMNRFPMERNEGALRLYGEARAVAAELGFELGEAGTGGASDGNFTSALGIPTLDGLGVIGDGAHAESEHVDLRTMPLRAALLAGLIERV
jgi:glutamate carboxypeptidase